MNRKQFLQNMLTSAAVATPVAAAVSRWKPSTDRGSHQISSTDRGLSLYDRVLNRKKMRCAYTILSPYCVKEPNTGKLSGIYVELIEQIGSKLDVDVEWVEEVGFGTISAGLDANRYDVHGFGLWRDAARGKRSYFSVPVCYCVLYPWVRADEKRFKILDDFNSPNVRISIQDGSPEDTIAKTDFPKAQRVSIPQLNPWSDNLLNVITNKADVVFTEQGTATLFLEKNPGALKKVGRPVRVFPSSYSFKMGEDKFKAMFDVALEELMNDGTVEKVLQKYEKAPGGISRVALPYRG